MVYISLVASLQQHQTANLATTYYLFQNSYLIFVLVQPLLEVQLCLIEMIKKSKGFDVKTFEPWVFLLGEREGTVNGSPILEHPHVTCLETRWFLPCAVRTKDAGSNRGKISS